MTVKTGIPLDMHRAHIPVFTAHDVVGRLFVELGHNRLFGSGNECSINEGIMDKGVILVTLHALYRARSHKGFVEFIGIINARQCAAHAQGAFIKPNPWVDVIAAFEECRGTGLIIIPNHLHRTDYLTMVVAGISPKADPHHGRHGLPFCRAPFIPLQRGTGHRRLTEVTGIIEFAPEIAKLPLAIDEQRNLHGLIQIHLRGHAQFWLHQLGILKGVLGKMMRRIFAVLF